MATTVPAPALGSTGYVAPDEATILSAVTTDINSAFGSTLNPALTTPQGQLATSLTAIIGDKNNMFLNLTSQVDPQYAQGRMQDAIARIYFLTRIPATPTVVSCVCVGTVGTVIAAGAMAKDTLNNIYEVVSGGTIGSDGTAVLSFANKTTGPTACAAHTLTQIYVAQIGWDTIDNTAAGSLGRLVETQQEFELRRSQSVGVNSIHTTAAIYAKVADRASYLFPANVPSDVLVLENSLPTTATVRGVSLIANSIYVSVIAPADADAEIAAAIWAKKPTGCGTNGSTSEVVTDDTYPTDPPEYTIKFQHAATLAIKVAVVLVNSNAVPSNVYDIVKTAIVNALPLKIGQDVYADIFHAPIRAALPGVSIFSVLVGDDYPTDNSVVVGSDYYATVATSDITVGFV